MNDQDVSLHDLKTQIEAKENMEECIKDPGTFMLKNNRESKMMVNRISDYWIPRSTKKKKIDS